MVSSRGVDSLMLASFKLSQTQRFIAFAVNTIVFYLAYVGIEGSWRVSSGGEALWLFSATAWWLLSLVSAPWFRPPRDALGAGAAAFLSLVSLKIPTTVPDAVLIEGLRYVTLVYAVVVAAFALVAAATVERGGRLASFAYTMASRLSSGEFLFGLVAFISIFGFHTDSAQQIQLTLLWLSFALIRPVELVLDLWNKLQREAGSIADICGEVIRFDSPNLIYVELREPGNWEADSYVACLPGVGVRCILPLSLHMQGELLIGTALVTDTVPESSCKHLVGKVFHATSPAVARDQLIAALPGAAPNDRLVGQIVERSEIRSIIFEYLGGEALNEGRLVAVKIGEDRVFYQIMNGSTFEESFLQNPRGIQRVSASQLGVWQSEGGFRKIGWLPEMNAPVFLVAETTGLDTPLGEGDFSLGEVPFTDLSIAANIAEIIEYHAAVLGVTGTGKTEVALDVVRQAHADGAKILCVDLTGEYRKRLANLDPIELGLDRAEAEDLEAKLFDVETGTYGAPQEKKVLKKFIDGLRGRARKSVADFLNDDKPKIAVFELSEVTNTKATLRITELFVSEVMLWARAHRKAGKVLIVLEEAHTIIPETMGAGFDYDTQWVVGRIGQIALQGRKYGVGLLIVSQRTALVSKTILSQCNTFLVHSLVDQTSLNFLNNVFQEDQVKAIPNLQFRQMIAYGKGINSERPVLIERPFDQEKKEASDALNMGAEEMVRGAPVDFAVEGSEAGAAGASDDADPGRRGPRISDPFR